MSYTGCTHADWLTGGWTNNFEYNPNKLKEQATLPNKSNEKATTPNKSNEQTTQPNKHYESNESNKQYT